MKHRGYSHSMSNEVHKISVLGIISQAAEMLGANKAYYFKVLLFPTLLMYGLFLFYKMLFSFFPEMPKWTIWAYAVLVWGSYAVFAVVCHRLVLLQADKPLKPYTLTVTRREMIFSLNLVVIAVVAFMLAWVTSIPLALLLNVLSFSSLVFYIPFVIGMLQTYFLGRFCLVLPSIAVDESISFKQSWMVTRGSGLRIFCIIGVVPLFWFVLSSLSGDSAEDTGLYIIDILFMVLQPVVLAFEVFLVSLTYREMKENWIASNISN